MSERHPRVVFFDAYPHLYAGTQRPIHVMAAALRERGWPVRVVVPGSGLFPDTTMAAAIPTDIVAAGRRIQRYGAAASPLDRMLAVVSLPAYWRRLARNLRGTADVVYTASQRGMLLVGPAARLAGVPLVWHVEAFRRPQFINVIGRVLSHTTIAISQDVARRLPLARPSGVPEVIPLGVTDEFFAVRRVPQDRPLIVTTARLHPEKGVDLFVRALAEIRTSRPDALGIVVGPPQVGHEAYAAELQALRSSLGLQDSLDFVGHRFVEDQVDVLARAALYVQPSRRESFGLATREAMAAGVPVVATAIEGLADVVRDRENGILVPAENASAIAAAAVQLLGDPGLADRVGRRGRETAWRECSTRHSVDLIAATFRRVAAS